MLRESVPADPELVRRSRRLLERFEWSGVAMVEYKLDARTGEPYLMEINGRFWGSLELAIRAGVDFPRLLVEACLGRPVEPVERYRTGVKCRWLWGDVDQLIARLRHSRAALALPDDAPGGGRALLEFASAFMTSRPEVFRLSDPWPFWRESLDWLGAALRGSKGEAP